LDEVNNSTFPPNVTVTLTSQVALVRVTSLQNRSVRYRCVKADMSWNGCHRLTFTACSLTKRCFILSGVLLLAVLQLRNVYQPLETINNFQMVSTSHVIGNSSNHTTDSSVHRPICLRPTFSGPGMNLNLILSLFKKINCE
jgi:hypothetical protein